MAQPMPDSTPSTPPSAPPEPPAPEPAGKATKPSPRGRRNTARVVGRWIKRGLLLVVVVAVVALLVKAWMPKPIDVDAADVVVAPMRVTVDEDGRTRVKDRYVVSAPLSGRVARIELNAGDEIKQGMVLARVVPVAPPLLDDRTRSTSEARVAAANAAISQTKAQITRAKATLAYAKSQEAKIKVLVAQGASARGELDRASLDVRTAGAELDSLKFAAQVARHELAMAQATLGRMSGSKKSSSEQLEIPAPITGRVLKVIQQSEGVVQAGTPLLEVGDPAALEIVVDVLTRDGIKIRHGAAVTIDRWGGAELPAHVSLIEPSAFTRISALGVEEQRVNVIVDLAAPREQWSGLGDGYRVETHITVWAQEDAMQVPTSAVFRQGEGWAVYRIDGLVARLTPVELGERNGRSAQITSGLDAGSVVIVHPSDRITDGVEVVRRDAR